MRIFNTRLLFETAINCGIVMLMTVGIFSVVRLLAFLRRAVQGNLPVDGLGLIFAFKLATFLDVILTPAIFIAILLVLMRWSRDNEITIYATGGVGPLDYLRPAGAIAIAASLMVAILSFFVTPSAELGYQHVLEKFRLTTKSTPFDKGQFRQIDSGQSVLYYSPFPEEVADPVRLFYLRSNESGQAIIVAEKGSYEFDLTEGIEQFEIENGAQYLIDFESLAVNETDFQSFVERVPTSELADSPIHAKAKPTLQLIKSSAPHDKAELNWRISKVVAVALVVFLAFSWGTAASRTNIGINLIGAVVVYFLYSSMLGLFADLVREGDISPGWLSVSPHVVILLLIAFLLGRSYLNRSLTSTIFSRRI